MIIGLMRSIERTHGHNPFDRCNWWVFTALIRPGTHETGEKPAEGEKLRDMLTIGRMAQSGDVNAFT